jgi:hypothetical protein
MFTYLGIDNTQNGRLVLICKSFTPGGKTKRLWRERLRGEADIRAFFSYLTCIHAPIGLATTRVNHDPGGVLAEHERRGGQVLRYYNNELGPPRPTIPSIYRKAEQLVTKMIRDEQLPMLVRTLKDDLEAVDSKISSLFTEARALHDQIQWLDTRDLDKYKTCDDIPF